MQGGRETLNSEAAAFSLHGPVNTGTQASRLRKDAGAYAEPEPCELNHLVYICSVCAVWQFCICSVAHYTAAPSQLPGHIWNTTCSFCNSYTTIAWLILLEPTIMHCLAFQLANFIKNYDTKLSLNIMRGFMSYVP